jgi:hypothetical protein
MSNCNIFELVGRDVLFPTMTSHTKIHYQPFGSDALASPFWNKNKIHRIQYHFVISHFISCDIRVGKRASRPTRWYNIYWGSNKKPSNM